MKPSGLDDGGAYCSICGIFCYAYSFDLSRILNTWEMLGGYEAGKIRDKNMANGSGLTAQGKEERFFRTPCAVRPVFKR